MASKIQHSGIFNKFFRLGITVHALLILFSWGTLHAELVDRILAVVNGKLITQSDLEDYQILFEKDKDPASLLEDLINQKLFLNEVRKFEVPVPSELAIQKVYQDLESEFGGTTNFEDELDQTGLSRQTVHKLIRIRLWVDQLLEQRINFFVFVSPKDIEAYIASHSDQFVLMSPDEARASAQDSLIRNKSEERHKNYLNRLRNRASILIN